MGHYLGLDLGTSSLKALIVDEDQKPVATASAALHVTRPAFGWSEQEPADWIAACEAVLSELQATHPAALASVRGIGLSGQMHGATLLDEADEVLRPCILWNDTRSHEEAEELDDEEARAITGNIVFPGFTAPKLLWVSRNEPRVFDRVRRVLLPKDYLRLWLTGEAVSDMSDAAGTAWLRTGERRWSSTMLRRTRLSESEMPRLVEGTEASGTLRSELARRWGLPEGVVVAGGGGDNAASACGVGVTRPGTGFLSLGTSGVLFTASAGYDPVPDTALHTFCHALPGLWHEMGVTLSAAGSLEWLSGVLAEKPGDLVAQAGPICARRAVSCSCPTSRASVRRTTTRPFGAPSSASRRIRAGPTWCAPSWKASPSRSATASTPRRMPPGCGSSSRSVPDRAPNSG